MFSLQNLIGTPLGSNNKRKNGYEFTPIGNRSRNPNSNHLQTNDNAMNRGQARYESQNMAQDKLDDQSLMDSTFDDTIDNLNNTTLTGLVAQARSKAPPSSKNANSFPNAFGQSNLVDGGIHSIKEQQNEMNRLHTENYNLKIELATLNKFLKQTPEEQRQLATQNIDLKQQMLEIIRQNKELQATVKEYEFQSNKENVSESGQNDFVNSIKIQYKEIIQEKDDQLTQYENQIETLRLQLEQQTKDKRIPDEILERLEFLQVDNQSLRRKIDDITTDLKNIPQDVIIRLNEANEENRSLQKQLENLKKNNGGSTLDSNQLQMAQKRISELESKFSNANKEVQDLEYERDSFESSVKNLRLQLQDKMSELTSTENELKRWKDKYQAINAEYDGFTASRNDNLSKVRHELNDLKQQKDMETEKLKREMKYLQKQLEEKTQEESHLRTELKRLIDSGNSASNKSAEIEVYQSQINTLRSKEARLSLENKQIRDELAELQDQAYQVNVNASRLHMFQKENEELHDRLNYYEKEYGMAQEALESAEHDLENFNSNKLRLETRLHSLERDNEDLLSRLKNMTKSSTDPALPELRDHSKKRDEHEKQSLIEEIDDLRFQVKRLQKELDFEKTNKDIPNPNVSYLEVEYQKISKEKNQLRLSKDEQEIEIREFKSKCNKLQATIEDKESLIESLESRVRELNKQMKLSTLDGNDNKDELLKLKNHYESKSRELEAEFGRLENDYRDQIAYYKDRVNSMIDQQLEGDYHKRSMEVPSISPLTTLLEQQLDRARDLNNDLSKKLSEALSKEETFSTQIKALNSNVEEFTLRSEKLQKEKSKLEELVSELKIDSQALEAENNRLELKSKNLANELNTSFKHCTKLASKLNDLDIYGNKASAIKEDDIIRAQRNNAYLKKQIDQLTQKMSSASISATSASKSTLSDELKLAKHQLQFYKAVLHDINLKSNDLSLMNDFMMKSIKNSNQSIKNELVKLAHCGIYPDYSSIELQRLKNGGKVSFRIVAQFVLAMVKIKRRSEKAELRRMKLAELKNEIEKDKITLLAG